MNLYRAFATVGGLTLVSRLLGFVRDVLIAGVLGTGVVAEAFFAAFRLPNLFRRLFGEGAFNSAFVPLFSKKLEQEGEAAARQFAEQALAGLLWTLVILTILAQLTMPWLVTILTPGFTDDPDKFDLTVLLTRICFPYLLCMSLVALLSGLLNALHKFAAAAAAPIVLNIVLVSAISIAAVLGLGNSPETGVVISWGVAVAGGLQLLLLAMAANRAGMGLGLVRPRWTPDMRRLVVLGIPGIIAGGITQINIVIGTMIASMQDGAIAYLYLADRIYQLPLGIVGIAIGVVLLPDISRHLGAGNHTQVMESQNRSMEFALLLTLPAAVALFIVPEPIIRVLFEWGNFGPDSTVAVAMALAAYAFGLPAFMLIKVFSPAYFAREDTRTPMIYAGISMLVNVVASFALFFWLRDTPGGQALGIAPHVGIALATTLAGWANALLLWTTLVRRGHFIADRRLVTTLPKIIVSSLAMGALLWGGLYGAELSGLDFLFGPDAGRLLQASALAALVAAGVIAFAGFVQVTGAADLPQLARSLSRRG